MFEKLKTFRINGRAVNTSGLTVGITQDVKATSDKEALAEVTRLTAAKDFSHIRIANPLLNSLNALKKVEELSAEASEVIGQIANLAAIERQRREWREKRGK